MPVATMTNKGQVTIPKKVRDALHLQSGDKLEFVCEEAGIITVRPVKKSVDEVFGKLYRKGRAPVSTEEMREAVEKKFKKEYGRGADESA